MRLREPEARKPLHLLKNPLRHHALDPATHRPLDEPLDGTQTLQAQASLYCSLDSPDAKGLNLSRLYLLMHEKIKDHISIEGIQETLEEMAKKQGARNAYCKLRFKYPWTQKALRSRQPINEYERENGLFETLSNGEKISMRKLEGHIAYNCILEGRMHMDDDDYPRYYFYLTTEYVYSATCPCSFELAHNATELRNAAANAHSQRSIMTTTVQFPASEIVWIEELIELHRQHLPTEVQVVVKRRDEQAFAELNGSNLLFSEDAVRLMYGALDKWYHQGKIYDFSIVTEHQESLHPWEAIAVVHKHKDITPIRR